MRQGWVVGHESSNLPRTWEVFLCDSMLERSRNIERERETVVFSIFIRGFCDNEKKILFDDDSSSFFKSFELLDSSLGNLLV